MDPSTPQFADERRRAGTYGYWPKAVPQTEKELAEAGFYYLGIILATFCETTDVLWYYMNLGVYMSVSGVGDHVQCFHCNGGLINWEREDVPWAEHARYFGECPFLLEKMGSDFVTWVKGRKDLRRNEILKKISEIQRNRYGYYIKRIFSS